MLAANFAIIMQTLKSDTEINKEDLICM